MLQPTSLNPEKVLGLGCSAAQATPSARTPAAGSAAVTSAARVHEELRLRAQFLQHHDFFFPEDEEPTDRRILRQLVNNSAKAS